MLLPASFVGAGLGQVAVILGNELIASLWGISDSFIQQLFVRTASNGVFGAAFVWIAGRVAPTHKSHAAMFTAGALVAAFLAMWLDGRLIHDGWDQYALVVAGVFGVAKAFETVSEERNLDTRVGSG